jgi:hypothetical protein
MDTPGARGHGCRIRGADEARNRERSGECADIDIRRVLSYVLCKGREPEIVKFHIAQASCGGIIWRLT